MGWYCSSHHTPTRVLKCEVMETEASQTLLLLLCYLVTVLLEQLEGHGATKGSPHQLAEEGAHKLARFANTHARVSTQRCRGAREHVATTAHTLPYLVAALLLQELDHGVSNALQA